MNLKNLDIILEANHNAELHKLGYYYACIC